MRGIWLAACAFLALLPGAVCAQGISPNPQAAVPTATGSIQGIANFVWNGTAWVAQTGTGAAGSTALNTAPGPRTLVPLDVATVTTGGTAVTALTAGHRTAGGWLQNPSGAAQALCINEIGTASGTTSAGNTTCVVAGQLYTLTPSANAVSVVSSDSAHPYSGYGLQ